MGAALQQRWGGVGAAWERREGGTGLRGRGVRAALARVATVWGGVEAAWRRCWGSASLCENGMGVMQGLHLR